ncbi:MAG: hypothetical protein IPH77_03375 [Ignavibacteria bacterium]|nr:hypothetical protein [Ignavibacteria bacterium]
MSSKTEPVKFGTDGWRGIIADTYTFVNVRRVALATALVFKITGISITELLLVMIPDSSPGNLPKQQLK